MQKCQPHFVLPGMVYRSLTAHVQCGWLGYKLNKMLTNITQSSFMCDLKHTYLTLCAAPSHLWPQVQWLKMRTASLVG